MKSWCGPEIMSPAVKPARRQLMEKAMGSLRGTNKHKQPEDAEAGRGWMASTREGTEDIKL